MKLVCLVSAGVFAMGGLAWGDTKTVSDADDVADVMDLASASHWHDARPRVVLHTISTYEGWSNDEFVKAEIRIWTPNGRRGVDRVAVVSLKDDNSLGGEIFKAGSGGKPGNFLGYASVVKSDERTFVTTIPLRLLGRNISRYRWKVFLSYPCSRGPSVTCAPPPPDTHPRRITHEL